MDALVRKYMGQTGGAYIVTSGWHDLVIIYQGMHEIGFDASG